jgi:hypothetical protein
MFHNLVKSCLFYVSPYALAYLKTFIAYIRIGLLFKMLLKVYLLLENHISASSEQIPNFFCKISINVVSVVLYLATSFYKSYCNHHYKASPFSKVYPSSAKAFALSKSIAHVFMRRIHKLTST